MTLQEPPELGTIGRPPRPTSAPAARSGRRRPAGRHRRRARGAGPSEPAGAGALRTRCRRDRRRQPHPHAGPDADPLAGRHPSHATPDRQRRRHGSGDPGPDRATAHQRTSPRSSRAIAGRWRAAASRPGSQPVDGGFLVIDGERIHDGLDIATFCGDYVRSAHDGVVLYAGRSYEPYLGHDGPTDDFYAQLKKKKLTKKALAIVVVIDDGNGYRSLYVAPRPGGRRSRPGDQGGRPHRARGRHRQRHRLPPPLRADPDGRCAGCRSPAS